MTKTDERSRSYQQVRADRRAEKKAARAAKKAAKPQGIDLPFRRSMPKPLLTAFGVVALVTLVLIVAVIVAPPAPKIAVASRRSPPGHFLSHDVGRVVLANTPPVIPQTKSPCPAFNGVVIEGGPPAQARIGGVMQRMCPYAIGSDDLARSLRALSKASIHFATFARTGDPSTLSFQEPIRLMINISFAQHDVSATFIAPLLAHEGFHLLHAGEPLTASMEFHAREVELRACRLVIDVRAWPRGCNDAQQIVQLGAERAEKQLMLAGFPKG